MATNPTLLSMPIAENGNKNVIPETTRTPGAMSQDQGFPAETSLPLGAGGVAPSREDINGAFNLLSDIAFYAQKGWFFQFDANQAYFESCVVRDATDGQLYEAINDVAAGGSVPSADTTNWKKFFPMTREQTPAFNKRDVVTVSGNYVAPVTGWYRIEAKGGGGSGGSGLFSSISSYFGGGGGGEGGLTIGWEHLTAGDSVSVVVGAGGSSVKYSSAQIAGNDGGNTTVTANNNAYVGSGGKAGTGILIGGAGGAGTVSGDSGDNGVFVSTYSTVAPGGTGGGDGGGTSFTDGVDGGGGGGGATLYNGTSYASGKGGNGYAAFEYFAAS